MPVHAQRTSWNLDFRLSQVLAPHAVAQWPQYYSTTDILQFMNAESHHDPEDIAVDAMNRVWNLGVIFRANVHFVSSLAERSVSPDPVILVEPSSASNGDPKFLDSHHVPYLAVPESTAYQPLRDRWRIVVGVEGDDRRIADSIIALIEPSTAGLALVHVTWLTGLVTSPLARIEFDNPKPSDLLLYRGARSALIDTARQLEENGFTVSTHLRNNKDPASALFEVVTEARPNLVILGLGRHGGGIGQRLQQHVPVPVLFVSSR
jgi:hypothetical protein